VNRLLNAREERDGDCLRRFVDTHDENAFAELVHHGPAVFGICRRALGDHQLAEDAFQAVFVILARKAATIRSTDAELLDQSDSMSLRGIAFSPDGKRILIRKPVRRDNQPAGARLFLVDLATKKELRIALTE